ncbi:uncharacterized protein LOC120782097 [Bactrocera tryoni]|uniref:uncharacterized protein LOC120782097 n=1 Tax=Bactrocera tryoni TaxID=59916 RepID=UPI001A95FAC8|nr:uncharacterized protein LOC120782097 [Bactrocera tryoni]
MTKLQKRVIYINPFEKANFHTSHFPAIGDNLFLNMFHDPVVPNETSCSVDCGFATFPRNFTKLFSTQIVNSSPQLFEMDFSSDDSIRDPDYIVSSATSESEKENQPVYISESILESPYADTDENVQNFTQPPKNIKKDRQLNRNSGRSYTTKKGKVVAGRKCLPLESCRKKCESTF